MTREDVIDIIYAERERHRMTFAAPAFFSALLSGNIPLATRRTGTARFSLR